jgi:hypothetical protein
MPMQPIQIAMSGVIPGKYGNSKQIPTFNVDARGRLTFAADINIEPTLQILVDDDPRQNVTLNLNTDIVRYRSGDGVKVKMIDHGAVEFSLDEIYFYSLMDGRTINGTFAGEVIGRLTGELIGEVRGNVQSDDIKVKNLQASNLSMNVTSSDLAGILINTDGSVNDTYDLFRIQVSTNDPDSNGASFIRTRGTLDSKLPIEEDDKLFSFYFAGTSRNLQQNVSAIIMSAVDGSPTETSVPGLLSFHTADQAGNTKLGLSIDSQQILSVSDNTVLSEKVNTSTVSKYLKIKIDGIEYAVPLYSINP